jgi:ribosomal protein S18 acetylase RimI-like enzyme
MPISLRVAAVSDAEAIARLTGQLGYDVSAAAVEATLLRILPRADRRFVVAELDARVVGWIDAAIWDYVETGPFVVIGGLVVDNCYRRQGIGRLLMNMAEEYARSQGCAVVRLWSSSSRTAAHRFYEGLGYANIKTQYSFAKVIDGNRSEGLSLFVPRIRE